MNWNRDRGQGDKLWTTSGDQSDDNKELATRSAEDAQISSIHAL